MSEFTPVDYHNTASGLYFNDLGRSIEVTDSFLEFTSNLGSVIERFGGVFDKADNPTLLYVRGFNIKRAQEIHPEIAEATSAEEVVHTMIEKGVLPRQLPIVSHNAKIRAVGLRRIETVNDLYERYDVFANLSRMLRLPPSDQPTDYLKFERNRSIAYLNPGFKIRPQTSVAVTIGKLRYDLSSSNPFRKEKLAERIKNAGDSLRIGPLVGLEPPSYGVLI